LLLSVSLVRLFLSSKEKFKSSILFLSLLIISLLPVIGIGISVSDSEGERFLLLPSIFLSLFVINLISLVFKKKLFIILIASILLIYNVFFHYRSINNWEVSSRLSNEIIFGIRDIESEHNVIVFVKNLPEKYNGVFVMRNGFQSALELFVENHQQQSFKILSTVNVIQLRDCEIQLIEVLGQESIFSYDPTYEGLVIDFSELEFCKKKPEYE
jgi:hypothetical protein